MPLTEKQLRTRDAKRDLGAELLEAVRDMKAGRGAAVGQFPTSTKKTAGAKAKPHQNLLTPPLRELQKALAQSTMQAEALAAAYGVKVPYARVKAPKMASWTSTPIWVRNNPNWVFQDPGQVAQINLVPFTCYTFSSCSRTYPLV